MSIIRIALVAGALAASAVVAHAAPSRLNDVQYIAANRCIALMESKSLGPTDAYALKALVKAQSAGRVSDVWDRAEQAKEDAASLADRASGDLKTHLIAERDGVCESLAPATQTTAAPSASHTE